VPFAESSCHSWEECRCEWIRATWEIEIIMKIIGCDNEIASHVMFLQIGYIESIRTNSSAAKPVTSAETTGDTN
jgi:hypothetical protein